MVEGVTIMIIKDGDEDSGMMPTFSSFRSKSRDADIREMGK